VKRETRADRDPPPPKTHTKSMSEMETMRSDLEALRQRLRDAGLDDSLPSEAASNEQAANQPEEAEITEASSPPPPVPAAASSAEEGDADSWKLKGNEHFKNKEFKEAVAAYTKALKALDGDGKSDAKILSNRAAARLALDQFVGAAYDGQLCIEVDQDWWKGYWYRGQALMKMLRNKPASTAMSERCEQAKFAFEGCLKCATLPDNKRKMVEDELQNCKNMLMQMTAACNQS